MQVSHTNDHVTHAVIGGKQTIDFGISSSAEFFNILSSTLYSDQKLAVAREVLCNAWDSHIASNIKGTPIQVSFLNGQLMVRDYGYGIHADDIGPIYGTYGNSTKKNDGNQTGGFGLGCKAPFAYTDHFEVTSYHDGVMTIYNMSKSSAEAMGKPSITPIMSAPTTKTGLKVVIKLVKESDYKEFLRLVQMIAFEGDMNVQIDHEPVGKLNFTDETNFIITKHVKRKSAICIRYGNVIYPVDSNSPVSGEFGKVTEILNKTCNQSYNSNCATIIFQAPAHSISVTPSRESLSMQEHTIKTLKKLFNGFISDFNQNFDKECFAVNDKFYKETTNTNLHDYLDRENVPIDGFKTDMIGNLRDISQIVAEYLSKKFHTTWEYKHHDVKNRISMMLDKNKIDKRLATTFLKDLDQCDPSVYSFSKGHRGQQYTHNNWFQKNILKPLHKKLISDPEMDMNKLYVSDNKVVSKNLTYYSNKSHEFHPAWKATFDHLTKAVPYLRNIMVLTHNKIRVHKELTISDDSHTVKVASGFLVYVVGKRKNEIQHVREFFEKTDFLVIDLTAQEKTYEIGEYALIKVPKKPRRKGIPIMSSVYSPSHNNIDLHKYKKDDVELIAEPKFYLRISLGKDDMRSICAFKDFHYKILFSRYGHLGGLVSTTRQVDMYHAKGIPGFWDYVARDLINYISTSPTLQEYLLYQPECMEQIQYDKGFTTCPEVINFIYQHEYLRNSQGLKDTRTVEDKHCMMLLQYIRTKFIANKEHEAVVDLIDSFENTVLNKNCYILLKKLNKNLMINFIDVLGLNKMLTNEAFDTEKQKIFDAFLSILNA